MVDQATIINISVKIKHQWRKVINVTYKYDKNICFGCRDREPTTESLQAGSTSHCYDNFQKIYSLT